MAIKGALTRMRSEVFRNTVSALTAWVVGTAMLFAGFGFGFMDYQDYGYWGTALVGWLIMWVFFTSIYSTWTDRMLRGRSPEQLRDYAARERAAARKPWVQQLGFKGATQLAVTAVFASLFLVIMSTQLPQTVGNVSLLVLNVLATALSWHYMVVVYATDYLELDLGEDGARHFDFPHVERFGDDPTFDDYLTLAIHTSVMGSMSPAEPLTRKAWRHVRSNAIVAFVFNTLVIAVVVSLLTSGLLG